LEAGKRRLAGNTARAATSTEVKDLKRLTQELQEFVAEQALELRLLKKSMTGDAGDEAEIIRIVEQSHLPVRRTPCEAQHSAGPVLPLVRTSAQLCRKLSQSIRRRALR
jgi:hypothetical protein